MGIEGCRQAYFSKTRKEKPQPQARPLTPCGRLPASSTPAGGDAVHAALAPQLFPSRSPPPLWNLLLKQTPPCVLKEPLDELFTPVSRAFSGKVFPRLGGNSAAAAAVHQRPRLQPAVFTLHTLRQTHTHTLSHLRPVCASHSPFPRTGGS